MISWFDSHLGEYVFTSFTSYPTSLNTEIIECRFKIVFFHSVYADIHFLLLFSFGLMLLLLDIMHAYAYAYGYVCNCMNGSAQIHKWSRHQHNASALSFNVNFSVDIILRNSWTTTTKNTMKLYFETLAHILYAVQDTQHSWKISVFFSLLLMSTPCTVNYTTFDYEYVLAFLAAMCACVCRLKWVSEI